jgi:hypothetical protein
MREDRLLASLIYRRHVQVTWGSGTGTPCRKWSQQNRTQLGMQYTVYSPIST